MITDVSPERLLDTIQDRVRQLDPARRDRLVASLRGQRSSSGAARPQWFLRPQPLDHPRLRLFCFPYAGGGASAFRKWQPLLPAGVEVCAVQLPGREWRVSQEPYRRLDDLLSDLVPAVLPLLDVPCAFFGHSMGALVAFELTRALRRQGAPLPQRLILSAFRAPQLRNPNIRIYHLPDEVLRTVLLKEGTPAEVLRNEELMKALLPTLRADLELCDTYGFRRETALPVPVHVFGGLQDVRVGRGDLAHWDQQAGAGFDLTMLPGSHFFLHGSQDLLLAHLSRLLAGSTETQEVVA